MITRTYRQDAMSRTRIYEWFNVFSNDATADANDRPRSGRPNTTSEKADEIKSLLDSDRRLTVRDISIKVGLGTASVHSVIANDLGMSKVCARWIPHILTDEQKRQRVTDSASSLKRYRQQGNRFLERIITADETWVSVYDPETKQDSSIWKTPSSPSPTKAMDRKSAKKMMFIVFFDVRGVVLCHAVPIGRTVTGKYYSKVLKRDLLQAIRKKRPGMEDNFILHHDNAPSHTSAITKATLTQMNIETLQHPPYSPDLAPCDFYLFPTIKSEMRGKRFDDIDDLPVVVREVICKISAEDFQKCFKTWVVRWEKCIKHSGEYFEKM